MAEKAFDYYVKNIRSALIHYSIDVTVLLKVPL